MSTKIGAGQKVTIRQLKQYLQQKSQVELVAEIAELFSKFKAVKDYYQAHLSSAGGMDTALVAKYKAIILKEFFPTRGSGYNLPRLSVARKAVSDYKKVSDSPQALADLMLFYVETGVRFTNSYGDIDEPFYNSMESMYERAVQLILKSELQDEFDERCKQIVYNTSGLGWGFHDSLSDIYHSHFTA